MNTPGLRFSIRLAARTLAKNRMVCAEARVSGDDAHTYNANRLEQLSEECLASAVQEYLKAVAGGLQVRECGWR